MTGFYVVSVDDELKRIRGLVYRVEPNFLDHSDGRCDIRADPEMRAQGPWVDTWEGAYNWAIAEKSRLIKLENNGWRTHD